MPCRYASSAPSAPSAPSTGVQTLPQPRRDAMVIGERYVPDRRWKAGWRSSHGEKCNRAITGTRLRKTMKFCSTPLGERRGEISRQGDGAKGKRWGRGPGAVLNTTRVTGRKTHDPMPFLLPKTCVAYVYGIHTRESTWKRSSGHHSSSCRWPAVIRFHDMERMERLGICLQSVARDDWTASRFTREMAATTWNRPRVHHMQAV